MIHPSAAWLLFLLGLSAGVAFASAFAIAADRRHRRDQAAWFKSGFLRGLGLGAANHAAWITRHNHIPANGFAVECESCGNLQECIIPPDEEYCACQKCGFRIPAPLCPGKEVGRV